MEQIIIKAVVHDLLSGGWQLKTTHCTDFHADDTVILANLGHEDEEILRCRRGKARSFVLFVYGNDGHDVVADHGTVLTDDLARSTRLAEEMA